MAHKEHRAFVGRAKKGNRLKLMDIGYSDTTSDVTCTHDRLGRMLSAVSSSDYSNNALGQRTKRADYFNASTINNHFDYNIFG